MQTGWMASWRARCGCTLARCHVLPIPAHLAGQARHNGRSADLLTGTAVQLHLSSAFGAFLDPVADKLMVCTALMLLGAQPPAGLTQVASHPAQHPWS